MHKDPPVVVGVFVDALIALLDVLAVEKAQYALFELPCAFAWDDFSAFHTPTLGFLKKFIERRVDRFAVFSYNM